ncbi:MAG: EAL domain-containing protein [Erysipelotrichaceae bacterium]|nr:EAL domain-containing protein [Erysipelotrichaceae bacterium]
MNGYFHLNEYSPVGDIVVMAVCMVMMILVFFSYFSKTRSSKLFLCVVVLLFSSAFLNVVFYQLAFKQGYEVVANWIRLAFHFLILLTFVYYIAYICEVTHYEKDRIFLRIANLLFFTVFLWDSIVTMQGLTFVVDERGISFIRRGIFMYGYVCFILMSFILLARIRKMLFHRVMFGFYCTIAVSMLILIFQGINNKASYTVASLMLPAIAVMYVLHSDPYDIELGTNDINAMLDYVSSCYKNKQDFVFMSLYLKEIEEGGKEIPEDIQASIRQMTYRLVKKGSLFKVSKGHMILFFLKKDNRDYEKCSQNVVDESNAIFERFTYKVVIGEAVDEISKNNNYVNYIENIHKTMPDNSIHRVDANDVKDFEDIEYIVTELADINYNENLNDPRVLVYCQPVLNVKTERYDTAEVLMRLDLKKAGIVYPDKFIHLAEEHSYIHMLTQIIIHKACKALKVLDEEGFDIRRISINVSALELKDNNFCGSIMDIIRNSGVPADKIAIELTESQNEGDFILMKQKISELKKEGIRFYLDDFGTGYSNMERIMELPFDIIKFDRSLVMASGSEERYRKMVANLAGMFSNMNYSVLYEGVEKDSDEKMCKDMSATYLQGYKYSKPVPIENLKYFLS